VSEVVEEKDLESVMRATIAAVTPVDRRGTAFGLLNAIYGVAWFAGSALLGVLYDWSVLALVVAAMALPILLGLARLGVGGDMNSGLRARSC